MNSSHHQTPPSAHQQLAPAPGRQEPHSIHAGQRTLDCLLYTPEGYDDASTRWPLLLFLHGAGERGHNLDKLKIYGPPRLLDEGQPLPFIVASPQCPLHDRWDVPVLAQLLDTLVGALRVDEERVMVSGVSMGGFATWNLATLQPERFAAIAPVCGGGQVPLACKLKDMPIWAFHGALDDIVPLSNSLAMVEAVRACGGDARLTIYEDAGHDAWTPTYANPAVFAWLAAQRRGGPHIWPEEMQLVEDSPPAE